MPTITTSYEGDMGFHTMFGRHRLFIDASSASDDERRGPTPPELFVASLGSCVAAMVANYCERNGLDARDLSVDVGFEKAGGPTRLVDLKVTVRLPNAECGSRTDAIRRVARHCPVHETIATLSDITWQISDRHGVVSA